MPPRAPASIDKPVGERGKAPLASSAAVTRRMAAQRTASTAPELALRRLLHARGLRYRVDAPLPLPGVRRRADLVFPSARVAVFVDGCFWHACPEHGTAPRANAWYWGPKLARNAERDITYSAIYCLNLRGGKRGRSGDRAKREGGNPFNIMTPVAITLLVKNPSHTGCAHILYHDIGDYLTREEKLARLQAFEDISGVPWEEISPNEAGDWINKRTDEFAQFMPMGNKNGGTEDAMFTTYSGGVKTNRDAWAYNFSKPELLKNMDATIKVYEEQRKEFSKQIDTGILKKTSQDVDRFVDTDTTKISWDGTC